MFEQLNPFMYPDGADAGGDTGASEGVDQGGEEKKAFDPSALDPEVQKYIDQQRTQASKTARDNARKKLMNDPDFRNNIRDEIQREENLTAEEKLLEQQKLLEESERKLTLRQNKLEAKERLVTSGLTGLDDIDGILDAVTTTDPEITLSNVDGFIEAVEKIVIARVTKEKQALLQNGYEVKTGTKGAKTLQSQYDEAVKNKDTMAKIRIKREAVEKGVAIQE